MNVPATAMRRIGRLEQLAIERQERDLALAAQPGGHPKGFWWDEEAADRVVRWIETFPRHWKGEWAGQNVILEPWERDYVVRPLFGWKKADGTRRFRSAWIEVARKNGKSTLGAVLGLYCLVGDAEPGGEVYCVATKEKQAKIILETAMKMVKRSPKLKNVVTVRHNTLSDAYWDSKMEPLSAEGGTNAGWNPSATLRDEVFAWTDPELLAILDSATGARRQPLDLSFTTAGVYDPDSVGFKAHEYAEKVITGAFEDEALLVFIAAMDEKDDIFDPLNWGKSNPSLGCTIKLDYLMGQAQKAKSSPDKFNEFLQFHANRWVNQVRSALPITTWDASDAEFDEEELLGIPCFGGLDLSTTTDLSSFVLAWRMPDNTYRLLTRAFIPQAKVEAEAEAGRVHYRNWVEAGALIATPGDIVEYKFIREEINRLGQRFDIQAIAYDPWNATQLATELQNEDGFQMVKTRPGVASMSEPTKKFIEFATAKKIRANRHPVMRSCVGNLAVRTDSYANLAPDKAKSKGKIDCAVAAILAISRHIVDDTGGERPHAYAL